MSITTVTKALHFIVVLYTGLNVNDNIPLWSQMPCTFMLWYRFRFTKSGSLLVGPMILICEASMILNAQGKFASSYKPAFTASRSSCDSGNFIN